MLPRTKRIFADHLWRTQWSTVANSHFLIFHWVGDTWPLGERKTIDRSRVTPSLTLTKRRGLWNPWSVELGQGNRKGGRKEGEGGRKMSVCVLGFIITSLGLYTVARIGRREGRVGRTIDFVLWYITTVWFKPLSSNREREGRGAGSEKPSRLCVLIIQLCDTYLGSSTGGSEALQDEVSWPSLFFSDLYYDEFF